MVKKVSGFACIMAQDQLTLSYTYNEFDNDGNILKANVRKSTAIKDTDIEAKNAITTITDFLNSKLND